MNTALLPKADGIQGLAMSKVGIGALHLSIEPRPSTVDAIGVIHAALSHGITLIDTADSYCRNEFDMHHNEALIRQALDTFPNNLIPVRIATKGGMIRPRGQWVACGRPSHIEAAILRSYKALGGTQPIDIWQYHIPDPDYEFAESLRPAIAAIDSGLIRRLGLCNVSLDQLKRARDMADIVSVQLSYSIWNRIAEFSGIVEYCNREQILFFAWSPLGGRQQHGNLLRVPYLVRLASEKNASIFSVALAWLMSKSEMVVPIPGTTNANHIEAWVDACRLKLTPDEICRINCCAYSSAQQGTTRGRHFFPYSEECLLC